MVNSEVQDDIARGSIRSSFPKSMYHVDLVFDARNNLSQDIDDYFSNVLSLYLSYTLDFQIPPARVLLKFIYILTQLIILGLQFLQLVL